MGFINVGSKLIEVDIVDANSMVIISAEGSMYRGVTPLDGTKAVSTGKSRTQKD